MAVALRLRHHVKRDHAFGIDREFDFILGRIAGAGGFDHGGNTDAS